MRACGLKRFVVPTGYRGMSAAEPVAGPDRRMRPRALAWLFVCGAVASGLAVQPSLTPRAIDEALFIGQSAIERDRVRFHAPYRLTVERPPVDFIEVITPFRRVVLLAEQLARAGNRAFSQRQALQRPEIGVEEIELRVELTFHPLNTYVAVPAYEVTLSGPGAPRIEARTFDRTPRYGPRLEGQPSVTPVPGGAAPFVPGASQPILGGTVTGRFDLRPLNPNGLYEVVVSEEQQELSRTKLDLSRLR